MPSRIHQVRCTIVLVVLIGAFAALGLKLFRIQVLQHAFFVQAASAIHERHIMLLPSRGRILDRNGKVLAMSKPTEIVAVNPEVIANVKKTKDPEALVARLAQIMDLPQDEVAARAFASNAQSKWIQRDVSDEVLEKIHALRNDRSFFEDVPPGDEGGNYTYRGIILQERVRRVYPNGELLAHVLGAVRHEKPKEQKLGYAVRDDRYPVAGIELAADEWLSGRAGWRIKRIDRSWREVLPEPEPDEPAQDGLDLMLTIDLNIQCFVEQAVARAAEHVECDGITALVLRPQTGEILGWANWPTFDPNGLTPEMQERTMNTAVETMFEPGSTLKPFTAAIALAHGVVTLETEFDCEHGTWRAPGGHLLHDAHGFEVLSVFDIIKKSSNIGIAKVALSMGGPETEQDVDLAQERLYNGLRAFGFGQMTGIDLPVESAGLLRPVRQWSGYSISSLPMGQEIGVTPLQLALAYCTLANGGTLMEPRLIACTLNAQGEVVDAFRPKAVQRVVSESVARQVRSAMTAVVSEGGTGRRADIPGYTQAGKTGTAQKIIDGRYSNTIFDSTFAGYAPADDPEVVIVVTLYGTIKPNHYGGTVAAPVFAEIGANVLQYLEVAPDEDAGDETLARARAGAN